MATMFGPVSKRFWFGMAIILLLILGASSVLYRLSKEKPLLKPDFLDSRFNTLALRPVRSKHPGTTDRSQEFAMDNRNQRSPARESSFPIQLDVFARGVWLGSSNPWKNYFGCP